MLKIKDNVDLKELEKYGFVCSPYIYIKKIIRSNKTIKEEKTIYVEEKTREISIHKGLFNVDEELNIIYDLIKDDLIEKADWLEEVGEI